MDGHGLSHMHRHKVIVPRANSRCIGGSQLGWLVHETDYSVCVLFPLRGLEIAPVELLDIVIQVQMQVQGLCRDSPLSTHDCILRSAGLVHAMLSIVGDFIP